MVRSPADEEEEKDAGTSSGSGRWPRTRRYAVGDEVEVLLTGKGFRGARYAATIAACLPRSGRYKVVYSRLVKCRGGPPLREVVAGCDVRPRPPPPPPGRALELFDLVEAFHDDGWWPGVVSDIRPKRRRRRNQETQVAVSLPRFREVMVLSASLVRPRREFVYGSWIDAQEVLRGIPQYEEGSRVEVMCDKQGRVWRPAIIKKMVGGTSYVVSYGNGESSIEVLDTRFIRPEPIYDKMKLEYELKPSAEKYARKRTYSDFGYSSKFSTPGDQYSSFPNKRVRKENAQTEEVHSRYSLNLRHDTDSSSLKDVMDMEIPSENHVYRLKKLEIAKVKEQILEANPVEKLICTPCDGKGRYSLPMALASKRKDLSDVIEDGSKYSFGDVVVISDDSSHGSFIEISDDSSYNQIKMRRKMNLTDDELHSNHLLQSNQAPRSPSRLWQAQNPQHYLLPDASRHSKEQAYRNVLSQSMERLESSQDHSHMDCGQQISLPGCQVQEFLGRNEVVEPQLLDHLHLENMLMKIDDSAAGGKNHEMCQKITEVNSLAASTSIEGEANQKTVNQSYGGAFPIGKLEPSSSILQDFEGNLFCIEAPNDNKIDTGNKKTGISPEEASAFLIEKLEPPSSGQKGVKADLVCIEACKDNNVEIKNEGMGMSLVSAEGFHLGTCRNSIVSYTECNASSQQPWDQPLEPVSKKSAGPCSLLHPGVMADISAFMPLAVPNSSNLSPVFSTTSLLLMPNKMEVFEKLPQNPHFRTAWNCPPELRSGRTIGLMVAFADMAESIKKMQIQDEPRLYDEKMRILLDMEEEDGFEAGPLKVRLHNLLCTRTCQINLKSRKLRLEKEIFQIEVTNCELEQRLKVLDMCVIGIEDNKYQEMKASLDTQKTENCSSISKLQADLCQVEESIKNAEADFCSIATAPWQSDDQPLALLL